MNDKKKYIVTIEEVVSDDFEIEATNFDEAIKIAEDKYRNTEIILSPGILIYKQMRVHDEENKNFTEWIDF